MGEKWFLKDIVDGVAYTRMSIVTQSLARTQAFLQGRRYVLPERAKRLMESYDAKIHWDDEREWYE